EGPRAVDAAKRERDERAHVGLVPEHQREDRAHQCIDEPAMLVQQGDVVDGARQLGHRAEAGHEVARELAPGRILLGLLLPESDQQRQAHLALQRKGLHEVGGDRGPFAHGHHSTLAACRSWRPGHLQALIIDRVMGVGPIIALLLLLWPPPVFGQLLREPQTPYHFLRYEDVPSDQQSPVWPKDLWAPIKFVPLDTPPGSYINVGGELRERVEHFSHPFFGLTPRGSTTYDLHRLLLNA